MTIILERRNRGPRDGTDPLYVFRLLIKRPHLIFHRILATYKAES